MTAEKIKEKIKAIEAQQASTLANYHAQTGAIQALKQLLAEMEADNENQDN